MRYPPPLHLSNTGRIRPALEKTLEKMKPRDIVVVFSDMDIYDWEKDETKTLLSRVASKASIAVLASTQKGVEFPRWVSIKVDVD